MLEKLKKCSPVSATKNNFIFNSLQFKDGQTNKLQTEMFESANMSGEERTISILCYKSLKLSVEETGILFNIIQLSERNTNYLFEQYGKWIFSLDDYFVQSAIGSKKINDWLKTQYDLHQILHRNTVKWLFEEKKVDEKKMKNEFSSLYLSLLTANAEFYRIAPESLREIFFRKMESIPKR